MHNLTRIAALCSTSLLLAACSKSEAPAVDTAAANTAAAPAPAPAPAPIALADLAGNWKLHSVPESGTDTSATDVMLAASADSNWTLTMPNGAKVKAKVMAGGDSIVLTSDEYSSVRRKNARVHIVGTMRKQGDELVGTTVAHYKNAGPDSVLRLRTTGTKAP
jgi:hypothetical protein